MRLEDYWGIGPKTNELLSQELGVENAIEAIESSDVRTLVDAGLPRGRATRILRHAHGGDAMDILATPDARAVYKELLDHISEYAVTPDTADRLRILTPLETQTAMEERLANVMEAIASWDALGDSDQQAVLDIFGQYEAASGGTLTSVQTALDLQQAGYTTGVFEPLAEIDRETLEEAVSALRGLSENAGDQRTRESISAGADERLDSLRKQVGALEDMAASPGDVLEEIRSGARGADELRDGLARHIAGEINIDVSTVREVMPTEATDARGFVEETLRTLVRDRREAVSTREQEVASQFKTILEDTDGEVSSAVDAADDIALAISLARFALAFDLTRPTFADRKVCAVVGARNLFLEAGGETVQPISYAVGQHELPVASANAPPVEHRVAVLTGANSGGKTTLLETLCQVQLLSQMGLPVPATAAEVGIVDTIVFHRRHASFNAGVLESTLRTVVPPVTDKGRTLMLVDEFEAITEPGSAANLLHGLVNLTVETDALGVFVTHLADDLEPLPEEARTDGIFAEGLTADLELKVDYQPRFGTVGRSTPEFIVSRLIANASDRSERAGYETLATAVGETAVQRTLLDARWKE